MVKSSWVRIGGKGPGNRSSGDEVHEEARCFLGIWHSWCGDWGEGLGAGEESGWGRALERELGAQDSEAKLHPTG